MKKIYILLAGFLMMGSVASKAQDTLLYQSFNFQNFYDDSLILSIPPGIMGDIQWYSYDEDGIPDASGSSRPDGWFAVQPYATIDTTNNVALGANSWTNLGEAGAPSSNWLITRAVELGAADTLFWRSASRQTPRFLDGYEVKISITDNLDASFLPTPLFRASEYTGVTGANDSVFTGFTYAPTTGVPVPWIHGFDYTHIEYAGDSSRWIGELAPHSVPLNTYAGQTVYIAFRHNSHDDNLISLDDVMVRGIAPNGINESCVDLNMTVFPNPAQDAVNVSYVLPFESNVTVNVYDVAGQLVMTEVKNSEGQGFHQLSLNTANIAKGFYTVSIQTEKGRSTSKLIVK